MRDHWIALRFRVWLWFHRRFIMRPLERHDPALARRVRHAQAMALIGQVSDATKRSELLALLHEAQND